ncbi:MAG: branched-chain amino acid ABC transporter permease [Bauldia litoralis]
MNFDIAALLVQDGLTNGAIYALLALSLVLVFGVTRVLYIPQGEFVAYGALTMAYLNQGNLPGTAWLALALGLTAMTMELVSTVRERRRKGLLKAAVIFVILPVGALAATWLLAPSKPSLIVAGALTLALVVPMGPAVYRVAFQPMARASILVLLFIAVAVHYVLQGLGLLFFGAEGWRTESFTNAQIQAGPVAISGQSLWIVGTVVVLILLLWLFFGRTLWGKALRATALNRTGARLVGIRVQMSGTIAFTLAALFGALSGILIAPITTIYYDGGFLIALKGFVGAVIGGLVSFPLAALGAVFVGLLESFASFYASALKEVIVFGLLIPVLLWRSFTTRHVEEEEVEEEV